MKKQPPNDVRDAESTPSRQFQEFCLLCLADQRPHWLSLTLQLDARGCHSPRYEWVSTPGEAIRLIRAQKFDCLIFALSVLTDFETQVAHILKTFQSSGLNSPVFVLIAEGEKTELARCMQADIEFVQDNLFWDSPLLLTGIEKAIRLHQLRDEHLNWGRKLQGQLLRDQNDSERILSQQQSLLHELRELSTPDFSDSANSENRALSTGMQTASSENLTSELPSQYAELMKNYVIQGAGNMAAEIQQFALSLARLEYSPAQAMQLHLEQVELLISGLGNRSGRHVLSRADLLALELMTRLAEVYQQR